MLSSLYGVKSREIKTNNWVKTGIVKSIYWVMTPEGKFVNKWSYSLPANQAVPLLVLSIGWIELPSFDCGL